jgi:acyl carrier protein
MEDRVKRVMAKVLSVSPDEIDENSSPDTIPRWDSLRHMNLILALEQEFSVTVQDEDIPTLISYPLILLTMRELQAR